MFTIYERGPADINLGNVLFNLCLLELRLGNWQPAVTVGERAAAVFRALDDRVREAQALRRTAIGYAGLDSWQRAAECLERALLLETGDPADQAEVREVLQQGLLAQALDTGRDSDYGRLRSVCDQDVEHLLQIVGSVAFEAVQGGDVQAAAIWLPRLQDLFKQHGDPLRAAMIAVDAGAVLRQIGELERAKQCYLEALPVLRDARETAAVARCLHNLGMVHRRLDELDDAATAYREALTLLEKDAIQERVMTMNSLGLVLSDLTRDSEATRQLENALEVSRVAGYHTGELQTLLNLTRQALMSDQLDLARQHWQAAGRVPASARNSMTQDFIEELGRDPRLHFEP